jgi:Na+/H+ antiporter NhaD/arsenite permease-like protein
MKPTSLEMAGTFFFALAVIHTFFVGKFAHWSHRFSKESFAHHLFHLLSQLEVVFALWAVLFMLFYIATQGWQPALEYQKSLSFQEPFFIFAVMVVCSTRPILYAARQTIMRLSWFLHRLTGISNKLTDVFAILFLGPLSGSFITEPAAMTVTALLLNSILPKEYQKWIYAIIAVLFVNVSIGGALTPFAAPPLLMVVGRWNWDFVFVFSNFGWKSMIAVFINSIALAFIFRNQIKEKFFTLGEVQTRLSGGQAPIPFLVVGSHFLVLFFIILTAHYQNAFLGIFLLFLQLVAMTQKYQDSLRFRDSLLVGLFLGGIIEFGTFQSWWLEPLLSSMSDFVLFKGAVLLTAITDNAALTYLGAQVPGLQEASRYALVAGALAGGGLTVIANAPNAAGYSILRSKLNDGLKPLILFLAALPPTAVAVICLWLL